MPGGDLLTVVDLTSPVPELVLPREKYEDWTPDRRLALPGLLLRLLELEAGGLREAGRGFSVLILSAGVASCEVDNEVTPDRYCGTETTLLAPPSIECMSHLR